MAQECLVMIVLFTGQIVSVLGQSITDLGTHIHSK